MVWEKVVVDLPGLRCAPCVFEIERAIRRQEGVIWATVNYAAEEVTIIYDSAAVRPATLMNVVRKLGFTAELKGTPPLGSQSLQPAGSPGRRTIRDT